MVAFRREKYTPDGGPAGGDGGSGGDVVFVVDEGLHTLMDFRYNRHFKATKGENGMSKGMHGRGAEHLVVPVPPGTVIKDEDTGEIIADLTEEGQEVIVARGGRGGRGNTRFATSRNPAPSIAENGEPGVERNITFVPGAQRQRPRVRGGQPVHVMAAQRGEPGIETVRGGVATADADVVGKQAGKAAHQPTGITRDGTGVQ